MTIRPRWRHPSHPQGGFRGIEALRGAWGAALLVAPTEVLQNVHGVRVDTKSRVIARILGARHLTQSALSGFRPSPEVLAMGVCVDAVHTLTALGLAAVDRSRARAGLADATIAAVWAAAGYRDLTHDRGTPVAHQRIRDQLAVLVLTHAPGTARLRKHINDDRRHSNSHTLSRIGSSSP